MVKKYTSIILFFLIFVAVFAEKEAMFYRHIDKELLQCELCPKHCVIPPNMRGECNVRINKNGKLYTLSYGRVAVIHIDPIEKKPQYHFYPGEKILSIATGGCNLHCKFCQNYHLSQTPPDKLQYSLMTPQDIINICKKRHIHMIAYTYSEPVIFYEFMYDTARLAHENGIKNVMVTAGYIEKKPLEKLLPYLDAVTLDIKSMDNDYYKKEIGGTLNPVLENAKSIYKSGVWLELVYLVIPGINDDDGNMNKFFNWVKTNLSLDVPIHLLKFYPNYKMYNVPPTSTQEMLNIANKAKKKGFHFVYIGNIIDNPYEDTYCPKCGKKLIDRYGYYIISNKIKNGECPYCHAQVPGRF